MTEDKKKKLTNIDGNLSFTVDAFEPKETEDERFQRDTQAQRDRMIAEDKDTGLIDGWLPEPDAHDPREEYKRKHKERFG